MKKKKQKRPITLIEIMIVILLIGIIGGALAFNMRGSMDEGRKFKTVQAQERISNILAMELAKGAPLNDVKEHWQKYVTKSPVGNGAKLLLDGWNEKFVVSIDPDETIKVVSQKLNDYEAKKNKPS